MRRPASTARKCYRRRGERLSRSRAVPLFQLPTHLINAVIEKAGILELMRLWRTTRKLRNRLMQGGLFPRRVADFYICGKMVNAAENRPGGNSEMIVAELSIRIQDNFGTAVQFANYHPLMVITEKELSIAEVNVRKWTEAQTRCRLELPRPTVSLTRFFPFLAKIRHPRIVRFRFPLKYETYFAERMALPRHAITAERLEITHIESLAQGVAAANSITLLLDCAQTFQKLRANLHLIAETMLLNKAHLFFEEDGLTAGFSKSDIMAEKLALLEEMLAGPGRSSAHTREVQLNGLYYQSLPGIIRAVIDQGQTAGRHYWMISQFRMDCINGPDPDKAVGTKLEEMLRHACSDIESIPDTSPDARKTKLFFRRRWPGRPVTGKIYRCKTASKTMLLMNHFLIRTSFGPHLNSFEPYVEHNFLMYDA